MQKPGRPAQELQRLAALQETLLLDTQAEPRFDRLTALVQQCFNTEIVLISLVDSERLWFKSRQGLNVCETSRDIAFCSHTILGSDLLQVVDASLDPRFADNPLVTGAPFIRFYAGLPLHYQGQCIGTLCIIDTKPRVLTLKEQQILRQFASVVEQEIQDRLNEQTRQILHANELMYRSVVEGTRIGTWQWNVQTGATTFNERWAEIIGYTLEELQPVDIHTWLKAAHPDDLIESQRMLTEHFARRSEFYDCKCRMKHKEGYWVWVHDRGRVISWTDDDRPLMMYGTHADITQQQEREDALKHSQQQLLKLTSQLPGVVYQYQQWPDGRACFPYASANLNLIYGVNPEYVKKDAALIFARIYAEDLDALAQSIEKSALELSLWQHQYRYWSTPDQLIWLSGRATPERQPDGSTLWHGYIENITEMKQYYLELERVNTELKLSQQRLEMASDTALIGFWQASLVTGELYWSPVIYKIFGFDSSIIPSVALFKSTVHPDDRSLVSASEQNALVTGVHDVVHRIILPDGTIRWVHEIARLIPESESPLQLLVGSVQDITERMQLQQMKDDFIAVVSHELRTPLTAISGALSIVNSGKIGDLTSQQKKLVTVAESNSRKLNELINDLLDIEKLSMGKMPFDIKPLNVHDELKLAIENIQPFAVQHRVTLVLVEAADYQVMADPLRLQQVLTNLLSNAIKFSNIDSEVSVVCFEYPENIRIEVIDTGDGIAPEFQAKVFERFAQADHSSTRQKGGTGLGLAICREIVEKMHGQIGFSSQPGQGATFFFELPKAVEQPVEVSR